MFNKGLPRVQGTPEQIDLNDMVRTIYKQDIEQYVANQIKQAEAIELPRSWTEHLAFVDYKTDRIIQELVSLGYTIKK